MRLIVVSAVERQLRPSHSPVADVSGPRKIEVGPAIRVVSHIPTDPIHYADSAIEAQDSGNRLRRQPHLFAELRDQVTPAASQFGGEQSEVSLTVSLIEPLTRPDNKASR